METTKQKLIGSLTYRIKSEIAPQNPVKFLKDLNIEDMINMSISILYLYTRVGRGVNKKTTLMTEVISAIGHGIRSKAKLKRDSAVAAKAGAFILYTFEYVGLIKVVLGKAANHHATYTIEVLDDDKVSSLWDGLTLDKTEKLPSLTPYCPWTSTRHDTGVMMVKTQDREVLRKLTPETHPLVFECLNRAQKVGWQINEDVYPVYTWALRNKTDAFADIWEMHNPEAKQSKIREAKAIGSIAKRFTGQIFYHLYYYDFRGRKYPATAYLHEQGTDLAKGLLLRADKKAIGQQGYFWLLISIASNWAGDAGRDDGAKTDKIPLNDRVYWSLDNEEILLSYAESPKVNQGWMQAEKPWQFLAACFELKKLKEWASQPEITEEHSAVINGIILVSKERSIYDYESHLECYIDGSNNGSQHLSALTKDEVTAPYVNLVPSDLPGDLYAYVGTHVWETIALELAKLQKHEIKECNNFIDTVADQKRQINEAELRSDRRKDLISEIIAYKKENERILKKSSCVYWHRIVDSKHKRKLVKRGVMTLSYGATSYGLGQQVIDDARKHGIEQLFSMEHAWGSYLGRIILEDCATSLEKPMRLLSVFEQAGRAAEAVNEFLSWTVPITNFPVVQHYTEGTVKKIYVQYGPPEGDRNSSGYYENTLQLAICFLEDSKPSKKKQAQGASPNAIHSLDAAHLTLAVCRADFPVTTIHDSFGCLLGDMADLFIIIRETFVELYAADPLTSLMRDIKGDISSVEIGNLDLTLILDSEYAFA